MTLSFDITMDDLVDLRLNRIRVSKTERIVFILGWLAYPIYAISDLSFAIFRDFNSLGVSAVDLNTAIYIVKTIAWSSPERWIIPFMYVLFFPFFYRWFIKNYQKKALSEASNIGIFCKYQLSLSDDTIHQISEMRELIVKCNSIKTISVTSKHIFIYFDSFRAFIVPRSAFGTQAECNLFLNRLKECRNQ